MLLCYPIKSDNTFRMPSSAQRKTRSVQLDESLDLLVKAGAKIEGSKSKFFRAAIKSYFNNEKTSKGEA